MTYQVYIVLATVLYFCVLLLQFRRYQIVFKRISVIGVLTVLAGLVLAKLSYLLLLFSSAFRVYGISALIRFRAPELSIVGGIFGVLTAIWVATKGRERLFILDVYAPVLAVMVFLIRAGEYFCMSGAEMLGAGGYLTNQEYAWFPLAIINEWDEAFFAVNLLECLLALCLIIYSVRPINMNKKSGQRISWVCYSLALAQIFFESLRAQCLRWGFVRVEQVLCAFVVLGMLIWIILRTDIARKRKTVFTLIPVGCILIIVLIEFAMDKTDIPWSICYAVMIALLIVMFIEKCILNRIYYKSQN